MKSHLCLNVLSLPKGSEPRVLSNGKQGLAQEHCHQHVCRVAASPGRGHFPSVCRQRIWLALSSVAFAKEDVAASTWISQNPSMYAAQAVIWVSGSRCGRVTGSLLTGPMSPGREQWEMELVQLVGCRTPYLSWLQFQDLPFQRNPEG